MRIKASLLAFGLGSLLVAGPPLHVAAVLREGAPPFEGEKRYRIEGDGAANLKAGGTLSLWRFNEKRRLARLVVVEVSDGVAFARVAHPEETYPMKGDLILDQQRLLPLPELPLGNTPSLPTLELLGPKALQGKLPSLNPPRPRQREKIHFLKGDSRLSPAGLDKIKAWIGAWGAEGQWTLEVPQQKQVAEGLSAARTSALEAALRQWGVTEIKVQALPEEPQPKYDGIYVVKEP